MVTDEVATALCAAGVAVAAADLTVEVREHRLLARLPGERIAWLPTSESGRRILETERRVLGLLAARCSFRVPRVLAVGAGGLDVRAMVPGLHDPWGIFARLPADRELARRIGREVGAILVEQHTRIAADDVAGWLPRSPAWPEPPDVVRAGLDRVVADRGLRTAIDGVLERVDRIGVVEADRALVHGDLGLHNLAFAPATLAVHGVYDYADAAWADRHLDFRYLVFAIPAEEVYAAAVEVYERGAGARIERGRVALYNAACSFSFLATRPDDPDARWCGRTLAEDLDWARRAIDRVDEWA